MFCVTSCYHAFLLESSSLSTLVWSIGILYENSTVKCFIWSKHGRAEGTKTLENGKGIDMVFGHGLYDTGFSETCLSIIKFME
jgi:hypothetical protein